MPDIRLVFVQSTKYFLIPEIAQSTLDRVEILGCKMGSDNTAYCSVYMTGGGDLIWYASVLIPHRVVVLVIGLAAESPCINTCKYTIQREIPNTPSGIIRYQYI